MHSVPLRIRRILDLARSAINRQHPDAAHAHLRGIRHEINNLGDPLLLAEYHLLVAEAFTATLDVAAEHHFQEAVELLEQIDPRPVQLLLPALEHYGDFLCERRAQSKAPKQYSNALQIATELHLEEDKARVHLKLLLIELKTAKHPEIKNFRSMKRVAGNHGYSSVEQFLVWMAHQDGIGETNSGLRAARNRSVANDRYFENLFQDMRS